ncbi:energy transducer TonB [Rhodocytophaga rosea]|uniref:Energy transducer TonB n=1 Tax=Rhodocytophaga rosea TaxID=2704465 RepID=A0A6C0GM08_9BACT|nr:energy transducer TonB [Rhodocytophaga rosea]QHT69111.1 energy transducer TonB [Rhodocytophaga rosea]
MEVKKYEKVDLARQSGLFMNIGLIVALGLCLLAFEWKSYDDLSQVEYEAQAVETEELIEIPITEMPPPPPPVIQQPEIVEVPDEEEIKEELVNLDTEITPETVVAPPAPPAPAAPVVEEEETNEIFQVVENQPAPVGGYEAFYKYIGKNIKYPDQARRMGVEGKVFVQFVVDKDGSITDVNVLKGIGSGCDEEAIRVVKSAPKWTPGKQRGRPVRVRMSVPIAFKLG